jgi:hydrogenase maturation protease
MISKTLILGLGNPILSDDGIGIIVARRLDGRIPNVDVVTAAMVNLDLLDLITGYDRLFVIDALASPDGRPGTLRKLTLDAGTLHLFSSHGVNFFEILELGKQLDRPMPEVADIYGIEIGGEIPFGEALTKEVARTLEENVERIEREIREEIES